MLRLREPIGERTPPHSLEAERSVIGSVLIKPAIFADLAVDLRADDFFLPAHREIWDAFHALDKRKRVLDIIAVADELKTRGMLARLDGGDAYLLDCANTTPTAENASHYARIVAGKAALRRLIATCTEVISAAHGADDPEEVIAEARAKVMRIDVADTKGGPVLIGDILQATIDSIELRSQQPQAFFRQTGWREFDETIGGLRGGNLITIAARPGKGKSAAALDILLHNAAQGIPCLLFSFEMTMMEIAERSLSKWSMVDGMNIGAGRMQGPEWVRISDAASKLSTLPLWLIDKRMTAERVCAITRRWWSTVCRAQKGHGLVCRDYLGLTKSSGKEESRAQEVAEMTGSAKELATEMDVPFIDVAQLNRDVEKEGRFPRLSDLRESGSIEQDSNMVIFVQTPDGPVELPPEWWKGDLPPEGQLPAALIVAKNRGGRSGLVPVVWEPKYVRFRDRPLFASGPYQEELL